MSVKIGLSTYSLVNLIRNEEMSIFDAIEWIAQSGFEHVEIVPFGFPLENNPQMADSIREHAQKSGIPISNYSILADFLKNSPEAYEQEIERVLREVDIANRLGTKLMRHDISAFRRPFEQNSIIQFEKDMSKMVEACRRIADYASQYGITTTVENHGFYVNGGDRIERLIHEVNRPNYKSTLDVGNFWCMDEAPIVGVKKVIPYAAIIHLKDFYFRTARNFPGKGTMFLCNSGNWFKTITGNFLRGAIVGEGDIDMWEVLSVVKDYGYNGYITIEFEGLEDCRIGSLQGLKNTRFILDNL